MVDLGGAIVCEETPNAIANGSGPHLRHTREEPSSNLAEKLKDLEGAENEGVEGTTTSTEQKPSKPTKAKKLKVKVEEQPTESATIPSSGEKGSQPSGHTKVLEKRDKALRKAERRAAKEAQRAEVESGDVPEVGEVEAEEPLYDLVPLPQPEPVPEPAYRKDLSLLPSWLASPIHVAPTHTAPFDEVGVSAEVAKGLKAKGFTDAFAVQAAVRTSLSYIWDGNLAGVGSDSANNHSRYFRSSSLARLRSLETSSSLLPPALAKRSHTYSP